MDPAYFKVMKELKTMLKYLFQTDNEFTIPVSGAGRLLIYPLPSSTQTIHPLLHSNLLGGKKGEEKTPSALLLPYTMFIDIFFILQCSDGNVFSKPH